MRNMIGILREIYDTAGALGDSQLKDALGDLYDEIGEVLQDSYANQAIKILEHHCDGTGFIFYLHVEEEGVKRRASSYDRYSEVVGLLKSEYDHFRLENAMLKVSSILNEAHSTTKEGEA